MKRANPKLAQKKNEVKCASIAPGIKNITRLSTISITVIEIVSAARASGIAFLKLIEDLVREMIDSRYPKKKARIIETIMVSILGQPK